MCESNNSLNKLDDAIKKSNDPIHYDPSDESTKSGNTYTENDDNSSSYDTSSEDGTVDSAVSKYLDKTMQSTQQNNIHDKSKISKPYKPKSLYAEFMVKEIIIQREKNPGLRNMDYMTLASIEWAKEWAKKNNPINCDPPEKSIKENCDSPEKSMDEKERTKKCNDNDNNLDGCDPSSKLITNEPKKSKTSYKEFLAKEIMTQREQNPGLTNQDYMTRAKKRVKNREKKI